MFNDNMSYKELSLAIYNSYKSDNLLSAHEIKKINRSIENIFLKKMLTLYPLDKVTKKFLRDSLETASIKNNNVTVDMEVHSVLYGGQREITLQYLTKNYPPVDSTEIIKKIESFLINLLQQPEAQKQLLIAESERYKIRERLHHKGKLAILDPMCSINDIIADFEDYIEHLRLQKNIGSTYAWDVLESIFIRRNSLIASEEFKKIEESDMLLLLALDDSRTAYHDKDYQFVQGKNYTCQKGLLERILDEYQSILPVQPVKNDNLTDLIKNLIEPFVYRGNKEKHEGPLICSKFLYQLYLQAANYDVCEKQVHVYVFNSNIDTDILKEKYEQYLRKQNKTNLKKELFEWDLAVNQIKHRLLLSTHSHYEKVICFLRENDALSIVGKISEKLVVKQSAKSDDEIFMEMLKQGPFIDKAHLELILCLIDPYGKFEIMHQMAEFDTQVEEHEPYPTKGEMILAYQKYLAESESFFYPFIDEAEFRKNLQQCPQPHAILCSQTAFCEWLEREETVLTREQAEKFSCLCCQTGYADALNILLHKYHVSANHVDSQQKSSLLYLASQKGHSPVVSVLISAGADIDFQFDNKSSPLIIATDSGHTDVVDMLLNAGANPNIQNKIGDTALRLAVRGEHVAIFKSLLKAGANPHLKNKSRSSAITVSIANNKYKNFLSRGMFSIDSKIKEGELSELKELINSEQVHTYYVIESIKKYIDNPQNHSIIEILLQDNIAQCIVRNKHQVAPLAWAVQHRCKEAILAFYKAGASIDEADEYGKTPLTYAKESEDIKIQQVIQQIFAVQKKNKKILFIKSMPRQTSGTKKSCSC